METHEKDFSRRERGTKRTEGVLDGFQFFMNVALWRNEADKSPLAAVVSTIWKVKLIYRSE
jgi:hypothetical protein